METEVVSKFLKVIYIYNKQKDRALAYDADYPIPKGWVEITAGEAFGKFKY
jgi:hypothetical protein